MKSQALIMNVIGAILLFLGILLHIVCMATAHMAGMDLASIKDEVNQYLINSRQYGSRREMNYVLNTLSQILSVELTYGPWKLCVNSQFQRDEICDDWKDAGDWIKATQAFSLLGVLAAIAALAVSAISLFFLFKGNWKKILPILACVLACGAGGLIIIEAIIFAAKYNSYIGPASGISNQLPSALVDILEDSTYLDWGFGLDIVAAVLIIVAGLIHVLSARAARGEGSI